MNGIDITLTSAFWSLCGGLLIGFSASLLYLFNGRIAGISGIAGRLLFFKKNDRAWRVAFLAGLLLGGTLLRPYFQDRFMLIASEPVGRLVLAGLLVGFGTALGGGCTSGHGVCGISRGSRRSIFATLVFMATAMITVFLMRLTFGSVMP